MTNLNAVNIGHNKFCGPAVLSILTGKSTDECAAVIASISGKYVVEGVQLVHLLMAASRLGFDHEEVSPAGSLFGSLIRLVNDDGLYIVTVPHHFVVIEVNNKQIYFCDNHTKEPMPAAASARLTQRVISIQRVFKRREPVQISMRTYGVVKEFYNGRVGVSIFRDIKYDMEKYDKVVSVAYFELNSREELKEFIGSLELQDGKSNDREGNDEASIGEMA